MFQLILKEEVLTIEVNIFTLLSKTSVIFLKYCFTNSITIKISKVDIILQILSI